MADARFASAAAMMGRATPTASVPTVNFNAANIIGTPTPVVGNSNGTLAGNYAGSVGQNIPKQQIAIIAVALIGIGYLVYHFNFEK